MKEHVQHHEVEAMGEALGASRSGFYRSASQRETARSKEDEILSEKIIDIHRQSRGTYGSPRIVLALQKREIRAGKNRVARLMRQAGIAGVSHQPKAVRTTCSNHHWPVAPNLVRNLEVQGSDQIWAADITYIGTDEGWGYLAAVLDVWSRKIVGWTCPGPTEGS